MNIASKFLKIILSCTLFISSCGYILTNVKAEEQSQIEDDFTNDDLSEQYFSAMDEEGNIVWKKIEKEENVASIPMTQATTGSSYIVEFSKDDLVISYSEVGTGIEGYINPYYATDAVYLGSSNGKVKFKLAGVTAWVDASYVKLHAFRSSYQLSYYYVKNGKFYHAISTNLYATSPASIQRIGNAPSYLKEGVTYYSYDGHYFYENHHTMATDYQNNVYFNSVNPSKPYYNYYQYVSMRTKSGFTGEQIDQRLQTGFYQAGSKLENAGDYFVDAEKYGTNALLTLGIAINESAWGYSSLAQTKNNLFGLNAVDVSPGTSASSFTSPAHCIQDFAKNWVSLNYMSPLNWVYYGPHLGDKKSGMNVKYASDPYWGEKTAAQAYFVEDMFGIYPSNQNDIMIDSGEKMLWIYRNPDTSSTIFYGNGNYDSKVISQFPFMVLGTVKNEQGTFYKIKTDGILKSTRSGLTTADTGLYGSYNYGYIKANADLNYIDNESTVSNTPSLSIEQTNVTLNVGSQYTLKAHSSSSITYQSSNTSVASVSSNGVINAKAAGSVTISVKAGGITKTCKVTVVKPTLTISKTSHTMYRCGSYQLKATTTGASSKITWKSSNEKLATVNSEGLVKTLNDGTVTITASANGLSKSCVFTLLKHTPVSSIDVSPSSLELEVGKTKQLQATILPSDATYQDVIYQTSDASIAKVSSSGIITAVKEGTVTISAISSNKKVATCNVEVIPSLTLSKTSHTMYRCGYYQIKATSSNPNSIITYRSSNEALATVTSNGKVYAKAAGTVKIYVSANGLRKTCTITIKKHIPVDSISFKTSSLSLFEGAAVNYPAKILPTNATYDDVTYTSSNTDIVKVSSYGRLLAKAPGTAYIIATSSNKKVDVLKVTVKRPTITLNKTSVTMYRCSYYQLKAECNKSSADLIWSSSNTDIATIDQNGRLYAKNDGTVTISVKADKAVAKCVFTIKKHIPVTSIALNTNSLTFNNVRSFQLEATITPTNATYKDVTYQSSNPKVATVDKNGYVKAIGKGTTIIKAISSNKKVAECVVTVLK